MNQTNYFYSTAISLWQNQDYKNAVSRMYYAVLHCMCDNLETILKHRVKPRHKDVRNLFLRHFSGFSEEYFMDMQIMRERVDYERRIEMQYFNEKDLFPMFRDMRKFVEQRNPSCKTSQ